MLASLVAGLLVAASFGGVSAASASPAGGTAQLPDTASDKGIYVVAEDGIPVGDSTFMPLPEVARGALIITPEVAKDLGLKSGKVSKAEESRVVDAASKAKSKTSAEPSAELQAVASSAWTNFWAPIGGGWSPVIQRNGVHNHTSEKYYSWYVASTANGTVCTQGTGYYTGYNGSTFGLWKSWYGLGCGTSGNVRVPWDNVMAYPEFQARAMQIYWGVPGSWI